MTGDGKAQRRRGLGMGLSALLGGGVEAYAPEIQHAAGQNVPIEFLRPSPLQPRQASSRPCWPQRQPQALSMP